MKVAIRNTIALIFFILFNATPCLYAHAGQAQDNSDEEISISYDGVSHKDEYPSQKRGPVIVTSLDVYSPKHIGMTLPYFRMKEGLKVLPFTYVRGEYMYEMQNVAIQSLLLEAQEFNRRSDSELGDYISTNNKHYTMGEVVLHYKEEWPKVILTYQTERGQRKYEGKHTWCGDDIIYDFNDKLYYKVNYTLRGLPLIGYLKLDFRQGRIKHYEPNNRPGHKAYDSYLFGMQCLTLFDSELIAEWLYDTGKQPDWEQIVHWKKNELYVKIVKYFPRLHFRVIPHYKWKSEEFFPVRTNDHWIEHKFGLMLEKDFNDKIFCYTNMTYVSFERDTQRNTTHYNHLWVNAFTIENEARYEIIRDLDFHVGFDYASGLKFTGFNNYTARCELSYYHPGLADLRIGYKHTSYYRLDENVDTVYVKVGIFM